MNAPKWWLRWRLRRAAVLLSKKRLNRSQYAALAEKFGHCLLRLPLKPGDKILVSGLFAKRLSEEALGVPPPPMEHDAFVKSVYKYGPYNEADMILLIGDNPAPNQPPPLAVWNDDHERRFRSARKFLSPFYRGMRATEQWLQETTQNFPNISSGVKLLVTLIVGAVLGALATLVFIGRK